MCSFAVQVGDEVRLRRQRRAAAGADAVLPRRPQGAAVLHLQRPAVPSRLDDAALARYLEAAECPAFTRYTVTDPKRLLAIIRNVRAAGHAVTEQEYMLHVVGAGVPVVGSNDVLYGVVSVAAPHVRCSSKRLDQLVPILKRAALPLAQSAVGRGIPRACSSSSWESTLGSGEEARPHLDSRMETVGGA